MESITITKHPFDEGKKKRKIRVQQLSWNKSNHAYNIAQ